MELHTKRLGVIGAFALMFLLLAGNVIATRRQLLVQLDSQNWATHSRQVILELTQIQLLLRSAESGQRGYLYTGETEYLRPYQDSIRQIQPHIDDLARLTSDSPNQQARTAILQKLAAEKLAELAQTVSLYQSGKQAEARDLVDSNRGLHIMDQIGSLTSQISAKEISIQNARIVLYHRSVQRTFISLYLTTAIAVLGLALLAFYILRQIMLRERHASQLLEREEWFRVTLTSLGDAVIATDREGNVTYVNPLAEQLIGLSSPSIVSHHIDEVFRIFNETTGKRVANPIHRVIERGQIVGLANHTVLHSAGGAMIPIDDSAAPIRDREDNLIGVVLVFRDATPERKVQELLRETEKLSAAARISASVAHEINNPLEAVGNLVFLARTGTGVPNQVVEYLEVAEQELERVSHIVRRTLGFYRESRTPELIDLSATIDYVLKLFDNRIRSRSISVFTEFAQCPPVLAIPGEMKQAISNLVANAADAVNNNGHIWVRLSSAENGGTSTARVEVEDDGPGISSDHIDRIFEPFYTTKKDTGTGLGLWVTKGIVERYGGDIEIRKSTEHGGACFVISLPTASLSPADADRLSPQTPG